MTRQSAHGGDSALLATRRAREVSTEQLVNRARQFGVALGLLQFGLFTDYLPGTRMAGLVIAGSYGLTAWWSNRVLASDPDLPRLLRLTNTTLALDTALLASTAIILAYQDDPTNLFLMVLPLLEAAMKRQLRGALVVSVLAMGVEAIRVLVRIHVHDLPVEPAESTFFGGMLLLIALFAGGTVRLQVRAQDALASVNDRLATTRRLLRSGLSSFSGGTGLQDILEQAVDGFAIDAAVVRPSTGPSIGWPHGTALDPVVDLMATELALVRADAPEMEHVDGAGRRWLALPIDSATEDGTLVVLLASESGREDARALQAELSALMRATAALAVEEEMRLARQRLDRLRHDFVAITTHEIRTPLTVMKGALELLRSPASTGREDELVEAAERHTRRLERVVRNLQVVQRLDGGGVGVSHSRVSIEAIIASVLAEADLDIVDTIDLGVQPRLAAWADAQLLQTVLRCLIENALTHGYGRDVQIEAQDDGQDVLVDVSDAGPGIPTQARVRIFERFAAADARHHHEGAGIGLPLARELARLMDGDVILLDATRTTFRLRLPARRARD